MRPVTETLRGKVSVCCCASLFSIPMGIRESPDRVHSGASFRSDEWQPEESSVSELPSCEGLGERAQKENPCKRKYARTRRDW